MKRKYRSIVDFHKILSLPWEKLGHKVVFQPCAQLPAYDGHPGTSAAGWPLRLPGVEWAERHLVIVQCVDFLTVTEDGCPELRAIEQHYGDRANRVVVIHWDIDLGKFYSGPLNLVYFPTHSYEFMYYMNHIQDQWTDSFSGRRHHIWQCLNGRECDLRKKVALHLQPHPNGILSYGDTIPLPGYPYSTYRGTENHENWMRLLPIYSDCDVNIVTETIYDNPLGIITEKTLMAFFARQVPIVVGYPGIVDHCEQLGFDMFRDIVDTSYDYLPNDRRWSAALTRNQHLIDHGIDRDYLAQRLENNYQWVKYGWPDKLVRDYQSRIIEIDGYLAKL